MKVKFFAYIRDYTKSKEIVHERCSTVKDLLLSLCDMYGDKFRKLIFREGELSSEIIILINGMHIVHYNGIDTTLSESDEISIFPMIAGG